MNIESSTAGSIAVIGGTGALGGALAARWARAGLDVFIGSRDRDRGVEAAASIGHGARGGSYLDAAQAAEVLVMTVPFASHAEILDQIADQVSGKLVIDTTVPLVPPKVMRVQLPEGGSAARLAANRLGEGVEVVSAFHNVAAHKLADPDWHSNCDVLVFGDKKAARSQAVDLARAAGLRGLHAGSLDNSAAAEALTSVLIFMNKFYAADGAGIQITGELTIPGAD